MIKIKIENLKDKNRNAWLELPANAEADRQAFGEMNAGIPDGVTVPYGIVEIETDVPYVSGCVKPSTTVEEINLLAYMIENLNYTKREQLYAILEEMEPADITEFVKAAMLLKNQSDGHAGHYRDIGREYVNKEYPGLPDYIYSHLDYEGVTLDLASKQDYDGGNVNEFLSKERQEYDRHT